MKPLILALALLTGDATWEGRRETLAGVFCPSPEAVRIVSRTAVAYSLGRNLERAGCAFLVLEGRVVGESREFGVGDTLFTFQTVISEGATVYRLNEVGQGFLA